MRRSALVVLVALAASACASPGPARPIVIGAVYPTGGGQGPGGIEEYRGLRLAAEIAGERRGPRPVRIRLAPADSPDAAPAAVEKLAREGIRVVAGSYGSTVFKAAADAAARRGLLFWETGAVADPAMAAAESGLVFRFAPSGESLGRAAVAFVRDQLAPGLGTEGALRYTVAFVDDAYGRSVGGGAEAEIRRSGAEPAAGIPYNLRDADYDALARRVAEARTDVLVVAAYLQDAVEMRRALVRASVPLKASIGTSSSYCMPEFGALLGLQAVGLFASDKPDGDVLDATRLAPDAADVLERGRERYRKRHGEPMSAAALSGFAAGWALFRHVLPHARDVTPASVAAAARSTRLEIGSLPNGSGLEFAERGTANLRATSVIWEWVRPGTRAVVWPPAFATEPIAPLPLQTSG